MATSGRGSNQIVRSIKAPTARVAVTRMEASRHVAASPRLVSDAEKAGTNAWFAAATASAQIPSGTRAATKNESVVGPAP